MIKNVGESVRRTYANQDTVKLARPSSISLGGQQPRERPGLSVAGGFTVLICQTCCGAPPQLMIFTLMCLWFTSIQAAMKSKSHQSLAL